MLVVARRRGENLVIGDSIVVKVSAISRNQVKLAVTAPRAIPILRATDDEAAAIVAGFHVNVDPRGVHRVGQAIDVPQVQPEGSPE